MKRPAVLQEIAIGEARHHCGGSVVLSWDINIIRYVCAGCQTSWSPRRLHSFTDDELAIRFYVDVPSSEVEKLVWVTTGKSMHSVLTKDPDPATSRPFTECD